MNCEEARHALLEALTGSNPGGQNLPLEHHLAACDACRRFAEVQRSLDARLTAAVPVVSLSAGFRSSLRAKLEDHTIFTWPDSLPDLAHLTGCALATVLLLLVLPQYSRVVLATGSAFTAVTYFFQAALRCSVTSETD